MSSNKSKSLRKFLRSQSTRLGLGIIAIIFLTSLTAPWITPFDPDQMVSSQYRLSPQWQFSSHFLGTDDLGRDTLSRLIYGGRISLFVGALVVLVSGTIGTLLGLFAGYFQGKIDRLISRFVDVLMSLPSILLAIVVVSILGPGLVNAIWAVSIVSLPGFIRLVRSSVMSEFSKEYVSAAKSLGAGNTRIIFRHILPNIMPPLIIQATLTFSDGILNIAALGFLGLGAQAPMAEWGTMLSDARAYIQSAPWLVALPGIAILITVLSFNLVGDGLRDAFDPKLKQ